MALRSSWRSRRRETELRPAPSTRPRVSDFQVVRFSTLFSSGCHADSRRIGMPGTSVERFLPPRSLFLVSLRRRSRFPPPLLPRGRRRRPGRGLMPRRSRACIRHRRGSSRATSRWTGVNRVRGGDMHRSAWVFADSESHGIRSGNRPDGPVAILHDAKAPPAVIFEDHDEAPAELSTPTEPGR
jgi:hypothetical protein